MLNKAAYLLLVNLASASTFIRFCRSVRKVYLCTTHLCNAMHPANFALLSFSHFPIHSLKSGIGNLQECSNRVVLSIQHPSRPELQLHKGFFAGGRCFAKFQGNVLSRKRRNYPPHDRVPCPIWKFPMKFPL